MTSIIRAVTLPLLMLSLFFTATTSKAASALPEFKVGYLPITHSLPVVVADRLYSGKYKHLKPTLVKFSSWPELVDAYNSGKVQAVSELLVLALAITIVNPRAGQSTSLVVALLAFVVYYNLINLSQAWVASGRIGLGSMLAALHCSAFMLALLLIWWRIHGVTLRSPRAATTATAA